MIGLDENELTVLKESFQKFSQVEKVVLFGSRAVGSSKSASDIDLAIFGSIDIHLLSKLKFILEEETTLPYFFDVVTYNSIKNRDLKEHIDKFGKTIYKK